MRGCTSPLDSMGRRRSYLISCLRPNYCTTERAQHLLVSTYISSIGQCFNHMPLRKETYSWSSLRNCLIIVCVSLWLLLELNIERIDVSFFLPQSRSDYEPKAVTNFLVNTKGCRIPYLDPMDVSVRKFIYRGTPINCAERFGPALVESNLTHVYLIESALLYYNVTDVEEISCYFRPFWRVEEERNPSGNYPYDVDSLVRFHDNCTTFHGSAKIDYNFVKIECFVASYPHKRVVYKDYHSFFPKELPSKYADSEKNTINVRDTVSVVIFGVDSVSRLNLYRQMPNTLKFLKNTLKAVEMLGYNKVGLNTFPNLIPVLTGLSVEELKKVCWLKSDNVFDDCNFIWNNYSSLGYKTAFGEDVSSMGLFKYKKIGFRKQPTDYYMRVFSKVSEDDIGFDSRSYSKLCIGPKKGLETLIIYASKFLITMKEVLTFSFFWGTSISHGFLNLPKYGDEDHKVFLENLYTHGIFNNTIMVFMSDHGIRWGGIQKTYQGYLEERLPFLFVVYPDWFRRKYTTAISNLKKNSQKLTTPFDLHEFLRDLTDLRQLEKETLKERSEELRKAVALPRGISLFLPISGNRTCSDAGIVDRWCTCHQSKDISTNSTLVRRASNYLVKHISLLLHNFPQCVKLSLGQISQVWEEKPISHSTFKPSDAGIIDFRITIQTSPGRGLFEATIRYDGNINNFTVVGTISRIDLYWNQGRCIHNYKLRMFCYCIHD